MHGSEAFMEQHRKPIVNTCSFAGVKPAMMDLPYPPIQATEQNRDYAALLSNDYCGAVSEMSAITQYINNENRMSYEKCPFAKTILGIAMAEMMHLQKLGELIYLLGGNVDFNAVCQGGALKMWTPAYLTLPHEIKKMIWADIDAEKAAVKQYHSHIRMIRDDCVNAVLMRIIKDEEYHIMMLQSLLDNY